MSIKIYIMISIYKKVDDNDQKNNIRQIYVLKPVTYVLNNT